MKSVLIILLLAILGALHVTAVHLYWYWTIWWFDIFMHVLGGLMAGLLVAAFFKIETRSKLFLLTLFGALVIGVIWEIYEYKIGMTFTVSGSGNYIWDTTSDMLADFVGGLLSYLVQIGEVCKLEEMKAKESHV